MAYFVNEQKMVEESTFQFEDRIKSPSSRFLDNNYTFVTYYHINIDETTVDSGFLDIASIIGHRSPIRFNKIENFPIVGLGQIVLQLQDDEQGLDTTWESEATILPNTIKPVQNDFFTIPVLNDYYVFRITDIHYDTIMPDNFYKIEYKLECIDSVAIDEMNKQVIDENVCILENIGSENKCIIEKDSYLKIQEIQNMYDNISELYKSMFYNERHNVFICNTDNGCFLYDPFQSDFINKNGLFNNKNNLQTLILTDQYKDIKRKYKYNKSIYRFIESRDMKLLSGFNYILKQGVSVRESSFHRWYDKSIYIIDIPDFFTEENERILSEDYVTSIKLNTEVESEYGKLIQKYVRSEEISLKDISMNLDDELIYLNTSIEVFFFTPIVMYIIQQIIQKEFN